MLCGIWTRQSCYFSISLAFVNLENFTYFGNYQIKQIIFLDFIISVYLHKPFLGYEKRNNYQKYEQKRKNSAW